MNWIEISEHKMVYWKEYFSHNNKLILMFILLHDSLGGIPTAAANEVDPHCGAAGNHPQRCHSCLGTGQRRLAAPHRRAPESVCATQGCSRQR